MKAHNTLPLLVECLSRWKNVPSLAQFNADYAYPISSVMGDFFEDFHEVLLDLNWNEYRANALKISPENEEKRFQKNLALVETLFGFKLEGEVFLAGTFHSMDGFARFERGQHKVYLGLDESHMHGNYLDILTTHELTHVARESRPEVWQGFGLDPKMSRADYLEYQPVIEHVFGEGFSCVVSEILIPGEPSWKYAYQTAESIRVVQKNTKVLDRIIKHEVQSKDGDYGTLYGIDPVFSQYVWGYEWVKKLLHEKANGDPRQLVSRCSGDFMTECMDFRLAL